MQAPYIVIPEFVVYNTIRSMLKVIRTDFEQNNDETQSFLYELCQLTGVLRYNVYDNAKVVFLAQDTQPRAIKLSFQYNQNQETFPNIYIQHAGEQDGVNAISTDQDTYGQTEYTETEENVTTVTGYRDTYSRRQNATIQVVITSDNSNETVMMYYVLKALFMSLRGSGHLSFAGLENVKISGSDIQIQSDNVPKTIHRKVLNLYFEYESQTIDLDKHKYALGMVFKGIIEGIENNYNPSQGMQNDGSVDSSIVGDDSNDNSSTSTTTTTTTASSTSGSTFNISDIYVVNEIPSGVINGINTFYQLQFPPVTFSEMLFLNGLSQISGTDYTINSQGAITLSSAPHSGDSIAVTYFKQ